MLIDDLRSTRICNIAVFDVVLGIITLYFIAYTGIMGDTVKTYALVFGIMGVIPIGELFHIAFKVDTPIGRALGFSPFISKGA